MIKSSEKNDTVQIGWNAVNTARREQQPYDFSTTNIHSCHWQYKLQRHDITTEPYLVGGFNPSEKYESQ